LKMKFKPPKGVMFFEEFLILFMYRIFYLEKYKYHHFGETTQAVT